MLKKITQYFTGEATLETDLKGKPTTKDVQLATAVLLLEMAGRDNDYAPEEVKAMADALKAQFHINDEEVVSFLESAESLRGQTAKIDRFIETINTRFSVKQKQLIMAMIWHVARADQRVDVKEQRFSLELKNRLHLTDVQVDEAKVIKIVVEPIPEPETKDD